MGLIIVLHAHSHMHQTHIHKIIDCIPLCGVCRIFFVAQLIKLSPYIGSKLSFFIITKYVVIICHCSLVTQRQARKCCILKVWGEGGGGLAQYKTDCLPACILSYCRDHCNTITFTPHLHLEPCMWAKGDSSQGRCCFFLLTFPYQNSPP